MILRALTQPHSRHLQYTLWTSQTSHPSRPATIPRQLPKQLRSRQTELYQPVISFLQHSQQFAPRADRITHQTLLISVNGDSRTIIVLRSVV
jgi:hypothetical protein